MGLNARSLHRILLRVTLASVHVFAWVFIFQYFYVRSASVSLALFNVLLAYALTQVVVILLTPVSARRIRNGFRRTLVAATLALSASFAILAAAFSGALGDIGLGIGLFALLTGIYRAFYWVPYALAKEESPAGYREWIELLVALAPLAAGLWLTSGVPAAVHLLYAAALAALASALPLARVTDAHEGYAWGYRETFHELFDPRHRALFWSSLFSGIEATALFVLWPITVFTILDWSYPLLGAVLSLTLVFTLVARKLFAPAIRAVPVRVQPVLAASGWIMRLGVSGFVGAVLIDTYAHTASRSGARGHDTAIYEQTADNRTFVDEYTALKEMGMALGRIALALIAALFLGVFALPHALALSLVIAALAAGFSVYHTHREQRSY